MDSPDVSISSASGPSGDGPPSGEGAAFIHEGSSGESVSAGRHLLAAGVLRVSGGCAGGQRDKRARPCADANHQTQLWRAAAAHAGDPELRSPGAPPVACGLQTGWVPAPPPAPLPPAPSARPSPPNLFTPSKPDSLHLSGGRVDHWQPQPPRASAVGPAARPPPSASPPPHQAPFPAGAHAFPWQPPALAQPLGQPSLQYPSQYLPQAGGAGGQEALEARQVLAAALSRVLGPQAAAGGAAMPIGDTVAALQVQGGGSPPPPPAPAPPCEPAVDVAAALGAVLRRQAAAATALQRGLQGIIDSHVTAVQLLHAQLGVIAQLNSDLQAQSVLPLLNELLAPPGPVPPPAVDDLQSGGGTPPQASGAADGEEDRFIGGDA